ncbi:MAG TPA: hypothetical protein VFJ09_14925 [Nocardioidaceae bacterium]|nr:hypothetical protein [Nocardioidaceae bacterium]
MDGLEELLRSGPPTPDGAPADVDDFLRRVRSGARRKRRRQRMALTAGLAGAAVAATVVGVLLSVVPHQVPTQQHQAFLHTTKVPAATPGRTMSFSASAPDRWWVLSSIRCPVYRTGCAVVSGSAMPQYVRVGAPAPTHFYDETANTVGDVRFAVDGTDGWAYGGALWSTHDGGHSWHQVSLPEGTTVHSVAAYGSRVYALVQNLDGRAGVLATSTSSDTWTWLHLPPGLWAASSQLVVARGIPAFAAYDTARRERAIVLSLDGGRTWTARRSPCGTAALAATGGSLWATCQADAHGAVYTSRDGRSWKRVGAVPLGEGTELAPRDGSSTLVYLGRQAVLLGTSGSQPVDVGLRGGELIRYAGFNDPSHGFLLTSYGRLLASTDGGLTWTQLD